MAGYQWETESAGQVGALPDGERCAEAVPVRVERVATIDAPVVHYGSDLAEHSQRMDGVGEQRDGHRRRVEVCIIVTVGGERAGLGGDGYCLPIAEADGDDLCELAGGRGDGVYQEQLLGGYRARRIQGRSRHRRRMLGIPKRYQEYARQNQSGRQNKCCPGLRFHCAPQLEDYTPGRLR